MTYLIPSVLFFIGVANPLHIPPWNSFHSEFIVAISVIIVLIMFCRNSIVKIERNNLFIFIVFVIYSFFNVNYFFYVEFFIYSLFCFLIFVFGRNERDLSINSVNVFFFMLGGYVALSLIIQFLSVENYFQFVPASHSERRAGGSLMQTNHSAIFVVIGIVGVINSKVNWLIKSLFLFVLYLGLGVTESRAAFLSLIIALLFFVFSKKNIGKLVALNLVFLISAFYFPVIFYDFFYINNYYDSEFRSLIQGGRLTTWPIIFNAILEKPFFGYGFNNVFYALDSQLLKMGVTETEAFHYSHNIILDLCVWFGVPFAAVVLYLFFVKIKKSFGKDEFFLIIPIALYSLFEYPHAYIYFVVIFFFLLGRLPSSPRANYIAVKRRWSFAFNAALIVGAFFYAKLYLQSEELIRQLRFSSIGVISEGESARKNSVLPFFEKDVFYKNFNVHNSTREELIYLEYMATHYPNMSYAYKYIEYLNAVGACGKLKEQLLKNSIYYKGLQVDKIAKAFNSQSACITD